MAHPVSSTTPHRYRETTWWLTVLVLAVVAGIRTWLLNFPLERDEGEYAYAGQLMLQGIPPYELAYNMKFPGTYAMYALVMAVFGQTPAGIHLGIVCLTTATALMLYGLGKQIRDGLFGMVAATSYAVLAMEPRMFGLAGHATHFCTFFATAGLWAMWNARRQPRWWMAGIAGLMFGTAVLMKQHAAVIGLWAMSVFVVEALSKTADRARWMNLLALGAGVVVPFGLCCLVLWRAGVFERFWFWTIDYARQYTALVPAADLGHTLAWSLHAIFSENVLLWVLMLAGLAFLWRQSPPARFFLAGFFVAALLTTVPGFYFRTHYFLLFVPAAALMAAVAVSALDDLLERRVPHLGRWPVIGAYLLFITVSLAGARGFWSDAAEAAHTNILAAHRFYGPQPFPEAVVVASFVREHSHPADRIAVLGSEPEIYFLAHRRSATGYLYMYPLMENQAFAHRMQLDLVHEIETNAPEFVVVARSDPSWMMTPTSDKTVFEWWSSYQTNYTYVGCADMISPANIPFVFGREAVERYGREPTNGLVLYEKKTSDRQ